MFPMSTRLSYAATAGGGGGADSDMEQSRRDLSPGQGSPMGPGLKPGGRMVRSSSDPSINTQENIPGIPPYPSPPTYKNQRVSVDADRLADLPLTLIFSVYTLFYRLKFGKIQIFHPEIRRNTYFFSSELPKAFPYSVLIHKNFFP